METMGERVDELAKALWQCLQALREVQPQVRGALPAQSVTWAIERAVKALDEAGPNLCANCGRSAAVGQVYCEDCELERTRGARDE
jgi:hypothetical protein